MQMMLQAESSEAGGTVQQAASSKQQQQQTAAGAGALCLCLAGCPLLAASSASRTAAKHQHVERCRRRTQSTAQCRPSSRRGQHAAACPRSVLFVPHLAPCSSARETRGRNCRLGNLHRASLQRLPLAPARCRTAQLLLRALWARRRRCCFAAAAAIAGTWSHNTPLLFQPRATHNSEQQQPR